MEENLDAARAAENEPQSAPAAQSAPADESAPQAQTAADHTAHIPSSAQSAPGDVRDNVPQTPSREETPEENGGELLESSDAKQIIENLLFITDRPLKPARIAEVVEHISSKRVLEIIRGLAKEYEDTGRAVRILEIGGGYQMCTKPEYGRWVRRLYNEKMTTRLSNAALETLAIIAYKQPVTRAEMEMIRGVDVAAPLERLLERGLVRVLGKRDTIGRPMVYGTTDEFLRLFGLNKISELPDLQVFAAKQLQEKQEDLPFDEKLPPLGEPAILALEEETGDAADAFFKRPKNMFEPEEPADESAPEGRPVPAGRDEILPAEPAQARPGQDEETQGAQKPPVQESTGQEENV